MDEFDDKYLENQIRIEKCVNAFRRKLIENLLEFPDNTKSIETISTKLDYAIRGEVASNSRVKHDTVKVRYLGRFIDIDKGISHLMEMIWKSGIHTYNSCENNVPDGYIWIEFCTTSDYQKFIQIVLQNINLGDCDSTENDLYQRVICGIEHTNKSNVWIYHNNISSNLDFYDSEEDTEDTEDTENTGADKVTSVEISVSVRFPQTDQDFVLKKFKEHLKRNKK